jgi:hypothetical protein
MRDNGAGKGRLSGIKLLRRRRDFARQRWPFGQHKKAVWRLAPTAAPRVPRVNLPMAAPFGLGSRRGISAYHRHCGTISFRQTRAPFGPHSDEDLRWRPGAPQACHFASVIANNLSIVNPQAASRRLEQLLSEVAPNGGGTSDDGVSRTPSSCQEDNRVPSKPFEKSGAAFRVDSRSLTMNKQ